jgi:hypothetical protein
MAKENLLILMEILMKVIGRIIGLVDMVCICIVMGLVIRASGSMIYNMA